MSFVESYDFLNKFQEPTFGEVDLWQNKETKSFAFGLTFPSNFPVQMFKERSNWNHVGVLELLAAEVQRQSTDQLKVYYEYFELTLTDLILEKIETNSKFSEQEIWFYMYQLLSSLNYLHSKGSKNDDLRPSTIFVTHGRQTKIYETGIYPFSDAKTYTPKYLAPEAQGHSIITDPEANDVFCLGLVILEICTLDSSALVFNFQNQSINFGYLQHQLQIVKSQYSQFLYKIVNEMLREQDRPRLDEFIRVLSPYEENIRLQTIFSPAKKRMTDQNDGYSQQPTFQLTQDPKLNKDQQIVQHLTTNSRYNYHAKESNPYQKQSGNQFTKHSSSQQDIPKDFRNQPISPQLNQVRYQDRQETNSLTTRVQGIIEQSKKLLRETK